MTAPLLVAQIQGQGTVSADNLNTYIQNCTNIEQLRLFIGLPGMCVFIDGTVAPGDGGAGPFYWNTTSIGPDNNSTVIVPQPGVPGAWVRLAISETSPVNVSNISSLEALNGGASAPVVYVEGYYTPADGGGGMYVYIPNDITSPSNGGTIIIDSQNHRYYLSLTSNLNVKQFGATGNGITDDTASIQSALNAGLTFLLFQSNNTYKVLGPILVTNNGVCLSGFGSTIIYSGTEDLFILSGNNCIVQGFTIIGNGNSGYAVGINANECSVLNCNISGFGTNGSGGAIYTDTTGTMASFFYGTLIDGNYLSNNNGITISNHNSQGCRIVGNYITNSGLEAITVDYNSFYCSIVNNYIDNCTTYGGVGCIGVDGGNFTSIIGNIIRGAQFDLDGTSGYGITTNGNVGNSVNLTITGNFFGDSIKGGIHFRNRTDTGFTTEDCLISGNCFTSGAYPNTTPILIDSGCNNITIGPNNYQGSNFPIFTPELGSTFYNNRMAPGQASFSANLTVGESNVTGDGTQYQVPYNNFLFAPGVNFNTSNGVFTAAVSGIYRFSAGIWINGGSSNITSASINLVPNSSISTTNITTSVTTPGVSDQQINISGIFVLNAGDEISVYISASGLTKVCGIQNNPSFNFFCGELIG